MNLDLQLFVEVCIVVIGFIVTNTVFLYRKWISYRMQRLGGGSVFTVISCSNGKNYVPLIRPSWKREFEEFGGKIEDGETGLQCALREFQEESSDLFTSINLTEWRPIITNELMMRSTNTKGYLWTVAILRSVSKVPRDSLLMSSMMMYADERHAKKGAVVEVKWFDVDKIFPVGRLMSDINDEFYPISGRTRRLLSDRRVSKAILKSATSYLDNHSSDSETIFLGRTTPPSEEKV